MYFPFKMLLKRTKEQIKSGKEFVIGDKSFYCGLVTIKSIPKDWKVSVVDDIVYVGKDDHYVSKQEVYVMLMLAENFQNRIRAIRFIQSLGING